MDIRLLLESLSAETIAAACAVLTVVGGGAGWLLARRRDLQAVVRAEIYKGPHGWRVSIENLGPASIRDVVTILNGRKLNVGQKGLPEAPLPLLAPGHPFEYSIYEHQLYGGSIPFVEVEWTDGTGERNKLETHCSAN